MTFAGRASRGPSLLSPTNMKKFLLLFVALGIVLAGCGSSDDSTANPAPTGPTKEGAGTTKTGTVPNDASP